MCSDNAGKKIIFIEEMLNKRKKILNIRYEATNCNTIMLN